MIMKKIISIMTFMIALPVFVFAAASSSIAVDPAATIIPAQFTNASIKIQCTAGHNWAIYTPVSDNSIFSDRESCGSTYYTIGNRLGDWQIVEYNPKTFVGSLDDISIVRKNKGFVSEAKYNVGIGEIPTGNVIVNTVPLASKVIGNSFGNIFLFALILITVLVMATVLYLFLRKNRKKISKKKK